MGIDRGFNSATNCCEFGFQIAAISATLAPRSGHDRATIGPRSGHDHGPDPSSIACRSIGDHSPRKELRSRRDRTRDRGFFHVLYASSDGASGERMATIARSRGLGFRGASVVRWKTIAMMITIATLSVR